MSIRTNTDKCLTRPDSRGFTPSVDPMCSPPHSHPPNRRPKQPHPRAPPPTPQATRPQVRLAGGCRQELLRLLPPPFRPLVTPLAPDVTSVVLDLGRRPEAYCGDRRAFLAEDPAVVVTAEHIPLPRCCSPPTMSAMEMPCGGCFFLCAQGVSLVCFHHSQHRGTLWGILPPLSLGYYGGVQTPPPSVLDSNKPWPRFCPLLTLLCDGHKVPPPDPGGIMLPVGGNQSENSPSSFLRYGSDRTFF